MSVFAEATFEATLADPWQGCRCVRCRIRCTRHRCCHCQRVTATGSCLLHRACRMSPRALADGCCGITFALRRRYVLVVLLFCYDLFPFLILNCCCYCCYSELHLIASNCFLFFPFLVCSLAESPVSQHLLATRSQRRHRPKKYAVWYQSVTSTDEQTTGSWTRVLRAWRDSSAQIIVCCVVCCCLCESWLPCVFR